MSGLSSARSGQTSLMPNEPGTVLTCTNDQCSCRLGIEEPCPHGDRYVCACGHPLEEVGEFPLADARA